MQKSEHIGTAGKLQSGRHAESERLITQVHLAIHQTSVEGQDLSRAHLAHHELASVVIAIVITGRQWTKLLLQEKQMPTDCPMQKRKERKGKERKGI